MAIEKINFSYPKGTLQSVFDNEALTALELAAKTSKKDDECVEIVNGVEQTAIEATTIVDDMYVIQNQFVTDNSDTRAQLVNDNQLYLDGLTVSKSEFEADINTSKATFEANIEASKTIFINNANQTLIDMQTQADNIEATAVSAVNTKVEEMAIDGSLSAIINDELLTDINNKVDNMIINIKSLGAKGDG